MTKALDIFGYVIGTPFILAGYLLSFLSEALIRFGAFFTNQEVIVDNGSDEDDEW